MKKYLAFLVTALLLVGCGVTDKVEDEGLVDNNTSQMVDEQYYLTGELLEKNDLSLLIDSNEVGLVWVSFDSLPDIEMNLKSIVKARYNGIVMESYPNQTSGTSIEIIEPFDEAFVYEYEALKSQLEENELNEVIAWNTNKNMVAYAQRDTSVETTAYNIMLINLYETDSKKVGYVKAELPDLAWFYNTLQIQTSDEFLDVTPPYEVMEEKEYALEEVTYSDEGVTIDYYRMTGYKGELIQDYINQSLYRVVEVYKSYNEVSIECFIVQQDDTLTVGHKGKIGDLNKTVEGYISIDVQTSNEWLFENVIADKEAFYSMMEMKYDPMIREQEGIALYLNGDFIVIHYVPMDDSAERVFYEIKMEEIEPMLNLNFTVPAS